MTSDIVVDQSNRVHVDGSDQGLQASDLLSSRLVLGLFAWQIIVVVLLQKFAVPGTPLPLTIAAMTIGFLFLTVFRRIQISPVRFILYAIFVGLTAISQCLARTPINWPSLYLLYTIYSLILFRFEVSWRTFFRAMNLYQNLILFGAAIVLLEDVWQFARHGGGLPNLDTMAPHWLLVPGFTYAQPVTYGSPFQKPNGFFFSEASFVSQFTALSVVIELVFFQRLRRLAVYAATMFACFAGTGFLLLAIISPLLVMRLNPRMALLAVVGGVLAVGLALGLGWGDYVQHRLGEVHQMSSSTNARFVYPLQVVARFLSEDPPLFHAAGAGNMPSEFFYVWLPVTKLVMEYGVVCAIAFHVLFLYALLDGAPSGRLAAALFVLFSTGGGYLQVPVIVDLCLLLGTLLRPVGPRPSVGDARDMLGRGWLGRWTRPARPRHALGSTA